MKSKKTKKEEHGSYSYRQKNIKKDTCSPRRKTKRRNKKKSLRGGKVYRRRAIKESERC